MELNLDLEKECDYCESEWSDYRVGTPRKKCKVCKGEGKIPTDFGREILTFIEKYFGIPVEDEQWRKY